MPGSLFTRTKGGFLLKSLALLFFLLMTTQVRAQGTAFDAASSSNTGTGTAASLTWSHTVGASGVNRFMIVGVSIRNSSSQTATNVTYNGTNMTVVGQSTNGTNARVEIWRLIAPAGRGEVIYRRQSDSISCSRLILLGHRKLADADNQCDQCRAGSGGH